MATKLDFYARKYSNPFRVWFGPKLVVIITDAENAELVLKSKECLNKPMMFYKSVRDAMKFDGLFTINGL